MLGVRPFAAGVFLAALEGVAATVGSAALVGVAGLGCTISDVGAFSADFRPCAGDACTAGVAAAAATFVGVATAVSFFALFHHSSPQTVPSALAS